MPHNQPVSQAPTRTPPPAGSHATPTFAPPSTPAPIRPGDHAEWRFKGTRAWRYIIIHHSATDKGSAASFDAYHRSLGWEGGLGYDFVIGNGTLSRNGQTEVGPRWRKQAVGAHAGVAKYNEQGIGICLVGDFNKTKPTPAQVAALVELVRWLQKEYGIPRQNVLRHKDVHQTDCPGKNFPWTNVKSLVRP